MLVNLWITPRLALAQAGLHTAQVAALAARYDSAWQRRDAVTVSHLPAPPYQYFTSLGGVSSRAETLAFLADPEYLLEDATRSEVAVTLSGSVAVLSSRWRGHGTYRGEPFVDDQRCGQVWQRMARSWQMLSEHCVQIAAQPSEAQTGLAPELVSDWQRNRATVLSYIDAMPDSATGYRPTPGVRTFAEQFDHIVTTNLEVAAIALRGLKAPPRLGDSAVYLRDKVALHRYADTTYAYLLAALQHASPAQLRRPVAMYGQPPQPAVRLATLSYEHSVWTLGQVVPYLRLNGVTPPEYRMPF
jgi:Domain of unknown function (DUF4440)/DinB superfamily